MGFANIGNKKKNVDQEKGPSLSSGARNWKIIKILFYSFYDFVQRQLELFKKEFLSKDECNNMSSKANDISTIIGTSEFANNIYDEI